MIAESELDNHEIIARVYGVAGAVVTADPESHAPSVLDFGTRAVCIGHGNNRYRLGPPGRSR